MLVPLARLSKNDQQWAKTEARVWEIIDGVGEKIAELRAKHKKLEAEKRQLDAKKNRSRTDLVRRNEIVDDELSLSTKIAGMKEERDQKVRKLYNEYSVATGQKPRYVDDGWGKLVSREVLAAREARENQREEQAKTNGTPRLAADNYIQGLLKNGTLQEATYLNEQFVTPGPQRSSTERAMGAALGAGGGGAGPLADPTKWKAVYYHVKYVSRGGFAMEKDSYVLTYRVENARVVGAGLAGGWWALGRGELLSGWDQGR